MDDGKFNMSLRKFLKQVGVTSQQQIERAVRESGKTGGTVSVHMVLKADEIGLEHTVDGKIDLD